MLGGKQKKRGEGEGEEEGGRGRGRGRRERRGRLPGLAAEDCPFPPVEEPWPPVVPPEMVVRDPVVGRAVVVEVIMVVGGRVTAPMTMPVWPLTATWLPDLYSVPRTSL